MVDTCNDLTGALGFALPSRGYFDLAGQRAGIVAGAFVTLTPDPGITLYASPTVAQTVRIRAGGNANDTFAGTGAQRIRITGLNAKGQFVSENLITAGAAASSLTSNAYQRINSIQVIQTGTSLSNVGAIQLESPSGPVTNVSYIAAGQGRSQTAFFSVPLPGAEGVTTKPNAAFLEGGIDVNISGAGPANLRIFVRNHLESLGSTIEAGKAIVRNYANLAVGHHFLSFAAPVLLQAPESGPFFTSFGVGFPLLSYLDVGIEVSAVAAATDIAAYSGGYYVATK